jgi:hypothetical protein
MTELDLLEAESDDAELVRALLPSTMAVLRRFMGDPERRASIPVSSCSGEQGAVWPERRLDDDGVPWHTLVELGGVEDAILTRGACYSQQGHQSGLVSRFCHRDGFPVFNDDFSLVIDRGPDEATMCLHVHYRAEDEFHARTLGIGINRLDDVDLAALVEAALEARLRGEPAEDALIELRDQAVSMGAERFGLSWRMPRRLQLDLDAAETGRSPGRLLPGTF